MKGINNVLVALLASLLATTATAALPDDEAQAALGKGRRCIGPLVLHSTLPDPFTIHVLPGPEYSSDKAWPLQVDRRSTSKETFSKPIISHTRIRQPEFRLTDGRLLLDNFPAQSFPVHEIFPPPLTQWAFGGSGSGLSPITFRAGYTCDAEGKLFLRLRADKIDGKLSNPRVPTDPPADR